MSHLWIGLILLTILGTFAAIMTAAVACCWTAKRMRELAPPPMAPTAESEAMVTAAAALAALRKD